MRKEFTVQNKRPRRTLTLFGEILAPASSPGRSMLDVSKEELLDDQCVRNLRTGRLELVRGIAPSELVALLAEDPEAPVDSPAPVVEPTPPQEELVPESEPVLVEEAPSAEELPVEEPPVEDAETTPASTEPYTAEALEAMSVPELRKLCKSLKLKSSGNEADLIERILVFQKGE